MKNQVHIKGILSDNFMESHEVKNERFFKSEVLVMRESGVGDTVPIIASEYVADLTKFKNSDFVEISGEVRTRNDDQGRLHMSVFVTDIHVIYMGFENKVVLEGYLCRKPKLRTTPLGREISDVLLAVQRRFGKADYVPCIIWGRYARQAHMFDVGKYIRIIGRFQSREYEKTTDEGTEKRTTYEISAESIDEIDDDYQNAI